MYSYNIFYCRAVSFLELFSCYCCGQIAFSFSLFPCPSDVIIQSSNIFLLSFGFEDSFRSRLFPHLFCQRCCVSIRSVRTPRISKSNCFRSPFIPKCLLSLSAIEERMMSPLLPAVKFVRLSGVTHPKI